jgi:CBS domain-containing protein
MTKMRDIMLAAPVCMAPGESVSAAATAMKQHAVRCIPVIQDGTPVGVVSIGDLALEKDATSALSGVSSAPPNC